MDELTPLMDGPIPGQSLTTEIGSRPWQQPAKFSTVEDTLEHYATKITDPKINDSLLDALEMGTPVASIAEIVYSLVLWKVYIPLMYLYLYCLLLWNLLPM